jgi:cytochrome b561
LTNPKPILPADTLPWQRLAERIGHFLLYLFLIVMPLSGWIMSSAADKPPHLLGWGMALPVPQSEALGGFFWNIHSWLAIVLIAFIVLHVGAALYHHFIKKDNILRRMLGKS